jgi:hypothetical protein
VNLLATLMLAAWLILAGPLIPAAPAQGEIADFGPLTAAQGWLLVGGRLYWTETAGAQWRDITPEDMVTGGPGAAAFAGGGAGWLVTTAPAADGTARYTLARTRDAGQTWQQTGLDLYAAGEAGNYPGGLYLERLDPLHGWLVVKHLTSSNFSAGDLFRTTDGGLTWERLALPLGEPVRFATSQVGYATGGPTGAEAYRTVDGGRTWQPLSTTEAAEEVEIAGPSAARIVKASDGTAWAAYTRGECDPATNRCTLTRGLRRTTDGGQTWTHVPFPAGVEPSTVYALPDPAAAGAAGIPAMIPAPRTRAVVGHGFDKCEVALPEQLLDWRFNSPYRSVNLYIGGTSRACSNRALSASLLHEFAQQGWTFIPTWVGPQAPCYAHQKARMDPNPAVSYWQGAAEAANAADALAWLGLTEADGRGSIVYYDMEFYDTNNVQCHEAVKSFIAGWTAQLHLRGQLSGVYGTGATLSAFANQPEPPDAIWAAYWIRTYFDPKVSVWDVLRLSNDLWVNHQRLRQYTGGHIETWGSTSLNIDADVLDGIVAYIPVPPPPPRAWLPLIHNGGLID